MPSLELQDKEMFDEVIRKHYPELLRFTRTLVRRMDAVDSGSSLVEDVIQEALMQAWQHPHLLNSEEDLMLWLYSALGLKFREVLRRERHWAACLYKMQRNDEGETHPIPEGWLDLYDALRALPKQDARLLYLYFWEGYSYHELCQITGCSLTNMTTKMHRIRKKLKKILKDD